MIDFNFIEGILICLLGIVILVLVFSDIREMVKNKVLREGKMDLETELMGKKKTISYMEKTIPTELYQEVMKEKGESIEMVPAYLPFAVMDMNTDDFNDRIHTMEAKDIFEFINQMLVKTVPYVYENGGVIDKFARAGFTAFFEKSCEDALNTAVSISEVIYKESQISSMFERFSLGLSYGTVLMGLAGTERRMSLITVSEYTGLSSFLQFLARKYDSRILITGTFQKKIEKFEQKFNARKLGYIYITATGSLEEIYDVFDGDSVEIRNRKRKTKIVFEKGVVFYAKGEYEKARQYFIEVFKTNRYDRAAKEYLNLCERNISEKGKPQPQIETY